MDAPQWTVRRRGPVAAVGAAVAAPCCVTPRPPNMPALDFGACAARPRPLSRARRLHRDGASSPQIELGQTHVVDVRELGMTPATARSAKQPGNLPRAPGRESLTEADFGAESHVGSGPDAQTSRARTQRRGHAKLTSGPRAAPPLPPSRAHLRGGDARARQRDDGGRRRARHARAAARRRSRSPSSSRSSSYNLDKYGGMGEQLAAWRTVDPGAVGSRGRRAHRRRERQGQRWAGRRDDGVHAHRPRGAAHLPHPSHVGLPLGRRHRRPLPRPRPPEHDRPVGEPGRVARGRRHQQHRRGARQGLPHLCRTRRCDGSTCRRTCSTSSWSPTRTAAATS